MVTARMHLNNNTTLELIDTANASNQSVRKQTSPFSHKAKRKKFVEERGQAVAAQILQQYNIEPSKAVGGVSGTG